MTPEGFKPNPKKIEVIQNMERPRTTTKVHRLIGTAQYYCILWQRWSYLLQPFTDVSSGKKNQTMKWTTELESAFEAVKQMVCHETLLTYLDWSKP